MTNNLFELNNTNNMTTNNWKKVVTYLVILIRSDTYKIGLRKHICPEGAVRELQDIVGSNDMKPGLVFVHRI